jgi:hypothetical protein
MAVQHLYSHARKIKTPQESERPFVFQILEIIRVDLLALLVGTSFAR